MITMDNHCHCGMTVQKPIEYHNERCIKCDQCNDWHQKHVKLSDGTWCEFIHIRPSHESVGWNPANYTITPPRNATYAGPLKPCCEVFLGKKF